MTSTSTCETRSSGSQQELAPLPMLGLVTAARNLFDQACGLAEPVYVTVSDTQHVALLFPSEPSSVAAITGWAMRFGAVIRSDPHQTTTGPQTWVRACFDYLGVEVTAFAHIPATTAS